jgi:ATP-dependent Clp protease ATP-binding subunit ClpB
MTSNIGSSDLIEGVTKDGEITEKARTAVLAEMRMHFRPEFLNRVDDIVLFKALTLAEIKQIVVLLTDEIQKRLAERQISFSLSDAAKEFIAKEGYDPVYGARPLKRFIQRELETKLGRALIAGDVMDGSQVTVDVKGQELAFKMDKPGEKTRQARASGQ